MSLDPMPDAATLLRMKAEREGRPARPLREVFREALVAEVAPITLRIPWSALVSDNEMYVVREGKRYTSPKYRDARKRVTQLAFDIMGDRPLYDAPLSLIGRVWVPNGHRRDVHNFGATIADSLKGVVFTDDHWLHDVRWIRAGVDVDAPRCELVITPLTD
jgi:Holliday junction resolvase RusA-like endonuclease